MLHIHFISKSPVTCTFHGWLSIMMMMWWLRMGCDCHHITRHGALASLVINTLTLQCMSIPPLLILLHFPYPLLLDSSPQFPGRSDTRTACEDIIFHRFANQFSANCNGCAGNKKAREFQCKQLAMFFTWLNEIIAILRERVVKLLMKNHHPCTCQEKSNETYLRQFTRRVTCKSCLFCPAGIRSIVEQKMGWTF